jgi:hypothetical protein
MLDKKKLILMIRAIMGYYYWPCNASDHPPASQQPLQRACIPERDDLHVLPGEIRRQHVVRRQIGRIHHLRAKRHGTGGGRSSSAGGRRAEETGLDAVGEVLDRLGVAARARTVAVRVCEEEKQNSKGHEKMGEKSNKNSRKHKTHWPKREINYSRTKKECKTDFPHVCNSKKSEFEQRNRIVDSVRSVAGWLDVHKFLAGDGLLLKARAEEGHTVVGAVQAVALGHLLHVFGRLSNTTPQHTTHTAGGSRRRVGFGGTSIGGEQRVDQKNHGW